MSCLALGCFIESAEVSQQLHKIFHWLNGEGSYAHIRISSFSLARIAGFQGEQVDGKCVCLCVCMCTGGGTPGLPWQLCLNQVWHPHMSENNGILYVFGHVSVSQQAQMESDGWSRLRRGTAMLKWESGPPRGHPCGWPAVSQSRGSLSSNIKLLNTSILLFSVFVYVCLWNIAVKQIGIYMWFYCGTSVVRYSIVRTIKDSVLFYKRKKNCHWERN